MSRLGFQKSVRLFHKFSEETARRRGGAPSARDGIAHLAALTAVLKAERSFTPDLLEPLAAFTNLLQSGQLPPEFGDYSFGDALLAIEESQAERRQKDPQHWEFEGELTNEAAAEITRFALSARPSSSEHRQQLSRFVLSSASQVEPGSLLVVGALAEPSLPWSALCERFARVTLSDVDLPRLEELVREHVPEPLRARVQLERYDLTGCAATFQRAVKSRVEEAPSAAHAEQALVELLQSYDVTSGSAGLSAASEKPDLAVSAMVLSRVGEGFRACVMESLASKGFGATSSLEAELELLSVWLVQHHVHALVRRAKAALLVSAVSEVELQRGPNGQKSAVGEPKDLLGVERLVERLPELAEPRAEQSWELESDVLGKEKRTLLTLVEAMFI
ncbi:MAG: hypothetical protein EOO73_01040 [Myxococcales bacterium]|nr:MAG: hypothetical protein EOO73_01040 [Myxococcales bacterium]